VATPCRDCPAKIDLNSKTTSAVEEDDAHPSQVRCSSGFSGSVFYLFLRTRVRSKFDLRVISFSDEFTRLRER
jgi:hypothetical protein